MLLFRAFVFATLSNGLPVTSIRRYFTRVVRMATDLNFFQWFYGLTYALRVRHAQVPRASLTSFVRVTRLSTTDLSLGHLMIALVRLFSWLHRLNTDQARCAASPAKHAVTLACAGVATGVDLLRSVSVSSMSAWRCVVCCVG